MLVHLGGHEDADGRQLDQVGSLFALGGQYGEVAIGDADGQIESILGVAFDSVQLLDQRNHRFSVLSSDT